MSPGPTERAHQWGRWRGIHEQPGLRIVGFEHWCGPVANLLAEHDDCHEVICSGCRTTIPRPLANIDEVRPLYRPKEPPQETPT